MPLSESVKRALEADLVKELPIELDGGEPRWMVLALPGTSAPVVALSRDPRNGKAVIPVFCVAVDNPAVLTELAKNITSRSSGKMPLWHVVPGEETGGLAMFPFLFDRDDDSKLFVDLALKIGEVMVSSSINCAFQVVGCSAMITRDGITKISKDFEERFV
ncbi:MAG: hypothetical protein ACO349_05665 [Flavobacteriaceae bacterium]